MKDFFAFFPLRSMKMNGGGKLFMQFQRTAISSQSVLIEKQFQASCCVFRVGKVIISGVKWKTVDFNY